MALTNQQKTLIGAAHAARRAAHQLPLPHTSSTPHASPDIPSTPSALVSWAHRGEGWSDAEAAKWATEVVEFTGALRANGIDADLDLFHAHETDVDWTRFGPAAVSKSEFVIVAISEAWAQRWEGKNNPALGAGAVAETDALKGLFQKDQSAWQRKLMVVILGSQNENVIPNDLMRATRFWVDSDDPDSFETLLRTLTGQPKYVKPDLEKVPVLPPAVAHSLGVSSGAEPSGGDSEFRDYSALLQAVKRSPRSEKTSDRMSLLIGLLDALSS